MAFSRSRPSGRGLWRWRWWWRGGEAPPAPPVANNLAAKSIQVLSAAPTIGYPMDVTVSIASTRAQDEVTASLYAIGKDLPEAEQRQIPLGTRTIPRVEAGEGQYRLAFDIPANVDGPREYHIGMIVNAAGTVEDENQDDNTASTVALLSQPPSRTSSSRNWRSTAA